MRGDIPLLRLDHATTVFDTTVQIQSSSFSLGQRAFAGAKLGRLCVSRSPLFARQAISLCSNRNLLGQGVERPRGFAGLERPRAGGTDLTELAGSQTLFQSPASCCARCSV